MSAIMGRGKIGDNARASNQEARDWCQTMLAPFSDE